MLGADCLAGLSAASGRDNVADGGFCFEQSWIFWEEAGKGQVCGFTTADPVVHEWYISGSSSLHVESAANMTGTDW